MKKITLLLTLLLTSGFTFAQVVLSEDFEAGLTVPAGWTNNDIAGNGEDWQFETGGEAPQFTAPNTLIYDPGGCAGNYAQLDSDAYGDNGLAENAALESPVFDCSALTEVTINYNHLFSGNFGGSAFVETSTDGTNWTTVQTFTGDGNEFGLETIDVSAQLAGQATSQVRFRWTGNWSLNWSFDNVVVSQCTETVVPACPVTVSPTQGQTDTPTTTATDGSRQVELSWNASATAVDYNIIFDGNDLGTTSSTSINIFGLDYGTTYTYEIRANNCFGQSTSCDVITFTTDSCLETVAPACPVTIAPTQNQTNVATTEATDGSRQVELSWNASATAVDYTVFFDGNELGNLADTSVNITGLALDTTYTYSILANNCFGQSTTCTTVTFTTETTLGTQENDILKVNVSPNPARDVLNINTSSQIDDVEIFDLLGKKVSSYSKESIYNNSINIASLPTGVYLVLISSENLTKTVKVIKE